MPCYYMNDDLIDLSIWEGLMPVAGHYIRKWEINHFNDTPHLLGVECSRSVVQGTEVTDIVLRDSLLVSRS